MIPSKIFLPRVVSIELQNHSIFPSFYYFCTKFPTRQPMFDNEDFEDYWEEEQDRKAAIERYEDMLKTHNSTYFDSEEFEYIIDQ